MDRLDLLTTVTPKTPEASTIPTSSPGLEAAILSVTKMSKAFPVLNSQPLQAYLLRKAHNTPHKEPTNSLNLPQGKVLNNPTRRPLFLTTIHTPLTPKANTMVPLTIPDMCPKASSSILPCSSQVLKAPDPPPTPLPNNLPATLALAFSKRTPTVKGCTNQEDMMNINPTLTIRNINISIAIALDCPKVLLVLATIRSSFMAAGLRVGCKVSWA